MACTDRVDGEGVVAVARAYNVAEQAPASPLSRPKPVPREEYVACTCPICFGGLDQRIRGLFCPRCKGWLVEELRDGRLVYSLWQGRP